MKADGNYGPCICQLEERVACEQFLFVSSRKLGLAIYRA